MNSSQPNPALPTWLFIAADIAALAIAIAIAVWAPHPLSPNSIFLIVACVCVGAIVGLLPLVARYERQKNETLDDRQRELESLARTIAASAEQISIATKGFHDVAELAQKNLRLAEHLPHKLQEKIAEFQSQLSGAADADKEELERELLALRTTESERLESVSQRIAKSTADWAKLENATQQHLSAANEALGKLSLGTAAAIGKAQAAAEQALAQARVEAARSLGETSGNATRAIETARSSALAELDDRLATAARLLIERVTAQVSGKSITPTAPANETSSNSDVTPPSLSAPSDSDAQQPAEGTTQIGDAGSNPPVISPPKRPRKIRREAAPATTATDETLRAPIEPATPPIESSTKEPPTNGAASGDEPLPIPANTILEVTPVAPATAEPFSGHIAVIANGSASPITSSPQPTAGNASIAPARKRVGKKPEAQDEPALGLELDDSANGFAAGATEHVRTSDGATRLLVTAYIGIGNRLFIRGQGAGLSWDKGVPLQFVSIGKWRWETNDANAAIQFKLYKNDDVECAALGTQSVDPGHQQEVTAAF